MNSIRIGVSRLSLLCKAASRSQVQLTSHVPRSPPNSARSFSISAMNCADEKTFNFNVQDEDDFQKRVLDSKTPIAVDFHAEWCGPCRFLGPRLEQAVDEHEGKILLAKVDVDGLSEIAIKYKVRAVPTVIGVKDGEEVDRFEGNAQDDRLKAFLNKLL